MLAGWHGDMEPTSVAGFDMTKFTTMGGLMKWVAIDKIAKGKCDVSCDLSGKIPEIDS